MQENIYTVSSKNVNGTIFKYISMKNENAFVNQNPQIKESDLISGIYEGGLKIWECTFDLLNYFTDLTI